MGTRLKVEPSGVSRDNNNGTVYYKGYRIGVSFDEGKQWSYFPSLTKPEIESLVKLLKLNIK